MEEVLINVLIVCGCILSVVATLIGVLLLIGLASDVIANLRD